MPTAYSYKRFSSPEQARGDSIRRQTKATADWCERRGLQLDETLRMVDAGVSAFRGKNIEDDAAALAGFREAVRVGQVPKGSYLVCESFDRLSRDHWRRALPPLLELINSGIKLVQLIPEQIIDDGSDEWSVMGLIMTLARGRNESVTKSNRVVEAWIEKQKNAATKPLTRRVPVWIRYDEGKLRLDHEKAKTVRKLFTMARNGLSLTVIATKLNVDQVPLLGRTAIQGVPVVWSAALVHKLLTGRAAIGEYQPHRERKPVGKPVLNYYPSVVDPGTFAAVQASLHSRAAVGRGRRGKNVNLFAGLMHDSRSGGKLMARHHTETETVKRESVIVPANAVHGRGGKWSSFPLTAFEKGLLSKLIEVKIEDVQGKEPVGNTLELLKDRLEEIETLTKKWKAKMDRPELIDAVAEKLVGLETERRNVNGQIEAFERASATTLSEALCNLQTVGKIIDDDSSDESRLRCRSAIHRAVESIWCLFMPGRGTRIAAAQVWFRGGAHRDYLISCRPGMANATYRRPVEWSVNSFASAKLPTLDLRKPEEAVKLEKALRRAVAKIT